VFYSDILQECSVYIFRLAELLHVAAEMIGGRNCVHYM